MPCFDRPVVAHMSNQMGRGTSVGAARAHRIAMAFAALQLTSRVVYKRRHETR
jgi:5-enolpyruvylshikimate-3-phosphate synthase